MAFQENYMWVRIYKIKNDWQGVAGTYQVECQIRNDDVLLQHSANKYSHFTLGVYETITEAIQSIFWNFNSKRNSIPWRIIQMPEVDEIDEQDINFSSGDVFTKIDDDIIDFEMDPELEAKLNPQIKKTPVYKDNVVKLKPKEDKK